MEYETGKLMAAHSTGIRNVVTRETCNVPLKNPDSRPIKCVLASYRGSFLGWSFVLAVQPVMGEPLLHSKDCDAWSNLFLWSYWCSLRTPETCPAGHCIGKERAPFSLMCGLTSFHVHLA